MGAAVVVLGPTASGKSEVAMAAALTVEGTEIIAVDAMQVYRGMDIGTAKPTAAERAAVVHHCVDLVDPSAEFTVADYQRAYRRAIDGLEGQALLVAGTGLYLVAAVDDLDVPGQWPEVRRELESEPDLDAMFDRLQTLDPTSAARIGGASNRRRLVRALEVTVGSGQPFSSFGPGIGAHPPTGAVMIGLRWSRPALAQRIERRVHEMVAAGLPDEVSRLQASGPLSRTARQALGYKELLDEPDRDRALEQIIRRTRQFAVRQERWFRRDPRVRWIDIDHDPVTEAAPVVIEALHAAAAVS
ncbi:MAG: tRNA (adenosine(37)-N6)-dimethylallyltransferase MiaA [Ilumatobacteraceae bacterium]